MFDSSVVQPFIKALIEEISRAFELSDSPVLMSFLELNSVDLPGKTGSIFSENQTENQIRDAEEGIRDR